MGSLELLLLAALTWTLLTYCLWRLMQERQAGSAPGSGLLIALLVVGFVVWPIGWAAAWWHLSHRGDPAESSVRRR